MPGEKGVAMDDLSPTIPIRSDYSAYNYDPDKIAETARTEASSTRDYKYENGRRYHAYREGSYPMPNDDLMIEHERIAHAMFGLILNDRLFLPPIEPKNVFDLGTGIGLWALDMAERYPDAKILGSDLTPPPQPLLNNLQFQVDDVTKEWVTNEPFDLVHIRLLYGAVSDWPDLYEKIFDNLSPGGYVQHIEIEIQPKCDDDTLPPNSPFMQWAILAEKLRNQGKHFLIANTMKADMEAAGFVDIVEIRHKLPLGPWSSNALYQQIGTYYEMFWRTGCQGWLMASMTNDLGWTPSQVNSTVEDAFKLIDSRTAHIYYEALILYGRKP